MEVVEFTNSFSFNLYFSFYVYLSVIFATIFGVLLLTRN